MAITPEALLNAHKAYLNSFLSAQQTALNSLEQLVELNFQAARSTVDQLATNSSEALNVKDPQQIATIASNAAQANPEQLAAYGKHVYDILTDMQSDFVKIAEAHAAQQQQMAAQTLEFISKNAPTGSESMVAMLKNSMTNAGTAYESVTKAAKQAAAVAESNVNAAMSAVKPVKATARRTK